jgi:uncharacterized protein (UPF0303 family)
MRDKPIFVPINVGSQFPTAQFKALDIGYIDNIHSWMKRLNKGVLLFKSSYAAGHNFKRDSHTLAKVYWQY